ncbi:MAG: sugar ABC transporter substrate-binding protein [Anaerolineae bacterium]
MNYKIWAKFLALLAIVAMLSVLAPVALAEEPEMTFYVVSHGGPADPFWGVVMRGVEDAGKALGVKAIYQGPEKYSIEELVSMLDAAIAAKPDGIAATITDPSAVEEPLRRAIEQGIPVIAINVADPRPAGEKIPYMFYIGADEYLGGRQAGERMLSVRTPKRAVCGNQEMGHVGLEARCRGFMEVMTAAGVPAEEIDITNDPTTALEVFKSYFAKHPDTDAVLTLGPLGTIPAVQFLKEQGLAGKVLHGTFDLGPETLDAIRAGTTLFAIDQQQYLQGYMSVMWLYLKAKYALQPANDILTGPGFVDASNVEKIAELIEAGYR